VEAIALLHGLHEIWNPWWLGGQLNLGGQNGIQAARNLGVRYWIGTHDEVKRGGGFVAKVLKRRIWGAEEVLEGMYGSHEEQVDGAKRIYHIALGSGESLDLI
jgi:hypothetical protein